MNVHEYPLIFFLQPSKKHYNIYDSLLRALVGLRQISWAFMVIRVKNKKLFFLFHSNDLNFR